MSCNQSTNLNRTPVDAMQHEMLRRWAGIARIGLEHIDSDPVLAVYHPDREGGRIINCVPSHAGAAQHTG